MKENFDSLNQNTSEKRMHVSRNIVIYHYQLEKSLKFCNIIDTSCMSTKSDVIKYKNKCKIISTKYDKHIKSQNYNLCAENH